MKLLPPFRPPFPTDALEPYLGDAAVRLHFGLTEDYVRRANKAIRAKNAGKAFDRQSLNFNVSGAKLHSLWWLNLRPPTPGRKSKIPRSVTSAFGGSAATLRKEIMQIGMAIEGSGWVALVLDKRRGYAQVLEIEVHDFNWPRYEPLLLVDVWEHSFLYDYGSNRKAYLLELWHLIDWAEVERRLG